MTKKYIPNFLYGTAWKEENTEELVMEALRKGFTGIDTANQRKHYFEQSVGFGILRYLQETKKNRSDLFLQTKFTFQQGQDHRLPYDSNASIQDQVAQSFKSSLDHLQTDYVDSYVLHGPFGYGIHQHDIDAWRAMEKIYQDKKTFHLGVSNVSLPQLEKIFEFAIVKPTFVQNRCYARKGWDREVRLFCRDHHIKYQGFSLLTANAVELSSEPVRKLAMKYEKTIPQITFRFAQQIGMLPITGTTNPDHMSQDLNIQSFEMSMGELEIIEKISA